MSEGLFQTLSKKFKLRYNDRIKSLRISATECNYKEIDRQLKEQFIHDLIDNDISIEIIRELMKIEDKESITSEQVLAWARRVEAQKVQSAILENSKEIQDFARIFTRNKVQCQDRMQL